MESSTSSGLFVRSRGGQRKLIWPAEVVREAVASSFSYGEVARKLLGRSKKSGGEQKAIKWNIEHYGCSTSHFPSKHLRQSVAGYERAKRDQASPEAILVKDSTFSFSSIRRAFNLVHPRLNCETCNIGDWNNKPLVLQLDHIDGDNTNNDPKNLRWLCPNCHSQTETFCGRNQRETIPIADSALLELHQHAPVKSLSMMLGLSQPVLHRRLRSIRLKAQQEQHENNVHI